MVEAKTKLTEQSPDSFLATIDEAVRADCYIIINLMERITGDPAKMRGSAIVSFGEYHYKYDSGREGEICLIGFSPRKGPQHNQANHYGALLMLNNTINAYKF